MKCLHWGSSHRGRITRRQIAGEQPSSISMTFWSRIRFSIASAYHLHGQLYIVDNCSLGMLPFKLLYARLLNKSYSKPLECRPRPLKISGSRAHIMISSWAYVASFAFPMRCMMSCDRWTMSGLRIITGEGILSALQMETFIFTHLIYSH